MDQYDKPFKTIDEQISYLQEVHGLTINDVDFAKKVLLTLSYYDLVNGYKTELMDNEKFKDNITIEYLSNLHMLDKDFQNILFKNSMLIENIFKTKLAYVLSQNFGVDDNDYLSNTHYLPCKGNLQFSSVKRAFLNVYLDENDQEKPEKTIEQPTSHYAYHHNHIPSWIILRNVSFSNAINLFRLMNGKEKKEVVELMVLDNDVDISDKLNFVVPALNLIRRFRNVIAHNLKFVKHAEPRYRLPKQSFKKIAGISIGKKHEGDVYVCVLAILILLDSNILREKFVCDLEQVFMTDKKKI